MNAFPAVFLILLFSSAAVWAQPRPPAPPSPPVSVWNWNESGSWLGVGIIEVNQESAKRVGLDAPAGVEIANVAKDSPAAAAGLERGDVVTSFRGERVEGVQHFARLVRETPAGREVEAVVRSAAGERSVNVKIGQKQSMLSQTVERAREAASQWDFRTGDFDIPRPRMVVRNRSLGATLESLEGQLAAYFGVDEGVLIREVEPDTSAAKAGLQAGDVITAIGGDSVVNPGQVRSAVAQANSATVEVSILRNKAAKTVEVEAGRRSAARRVIEARPVSR